MKRRFRIPLDAAQGLNLFVSLTTWASRRMRVIASAGIAPHTIDDGGLRVLDQLDLAAVHELAPAW